MDQKISGVDPITFEILSHRLYQIAVEMGLTLERVGGTVNTTQQHDYMASLYRVNGDILTAGESTGWHVACAGFAVRKIIERFGNDGNIYPDDVFLLNDPYSAAIHQSDVYMISPIHYREQLAGWSATFVHVMDIGAMSPGGNSPGATEVFHEGLRIRGIKLVERGQLRKDVFDTLIHMTRQPAMVALDFKCEMAANNVAKRRVLEMYAQYGPEVIDAVSAEMIRFSESVVTSRIREISDGVWHETATIHGDETWRIRLTLTKKGDQLHFDFTGTDGQARRGINLPYHATFGACFEGVLATLAYDIPKNHGILRPIEVIAPEGTVVNVQYPGPVSMNTTSAGPVVKYVARSVLLQMAATSERWSDEVMALNVGYRSVRHAGINQYGTYYVSGLGSENALAGSGSRSFWDGTNSGIGRQSASNVEWVELNFPLLYLFRRHAKDSTGAGKFRGGVGGEMAVTLHDAPEGKIKGVAYGVPGLKNSGQGIFGGYPAAPSLLVLRERTKLPGVLATNQCPDDLEELGGEARVLPYCEFEIRQDDVLYMRQSSGGGYGDPLERDPRKVSEDVMQGVTSREVARDIYGVVIDEQGWNGEETDNLRAQMKRER